MLLPTLPARRLHVADHAWAAALLAAAYAADGAGDAPPTGPHAGADYRRWLHLLLHYALHAGCVYAGPANDSVAVWLPADAAALSWGGLLRTGQLTLPLRLGWGRCRTLLQQQRQHDARRHRALPAPHHYLLALGVLPAAQRRGAGRALLRASLAAVGAGFLPCYAEAHSFAGLHLARQLGFGVAAYQAAPRPGGRPCWGLVRAAGIVG